MLQDVCISKQEPWCRRENRTMPLQISIGIEFYNGTVRFLCHSTAFLYRPTSATAQMLKLDKVPARWFSRRWRKITAIAENHGHDRKKPQLSILSTIPIISTYLYSVTFVHDSQSHKSQPQVPTGSHVHNTQYL